MRFTKQENIKTMEYHYRSKPARRGDTRRMASIWAERGDFELTENRLVMQAGVIVNKQWPTTKGCMISRQEKL